DGTWTFTSYDETSKVVDEAEEKFVGTWTFTPSETPEEKPAKVVHEFVSGTPGKELPQEVKDLLPSGFDTKFDETVEPKQPTETTVKVSDGTWTFTSYDETSKVVDEAEEKFVGTWTFTPKKPDGNNPGDNGGGETVTEKGNVVVKHYKVGTTEEVRNGRTLPEENVGTQYNVTADKVTGEFVGLDGKTYEYVSDTNNTTGNIVKGTTEVIYYYREVPTTPEEPTPPTTTPDNPGTTTPDNPGTTTPDNPGDNGDGETVTEKGNVVVKHYKVGTTEEVRNGRTLPEENVGTQYNVTADKVTGEFVGLDGKTYEYVSDTNNTTGNIVNGTTEVIYYYREVPTTPEEPTPPTTTPDNPGTTTPDNPGTTTPDNPGTTTPDNPGTTTPDNPGTTTPDNPGTTTPDNPGTTTPDNPGTTTPDNPGTTTPDNPGTTTPGNPGTTTPDNPGTTTPDNPGTTTPDNPDTTTPDNPGTTTPDNPGTTTPDNPGTTTPDNPGTTTPDNPGTPTPSTGTITVTPKVGTSQLPNTGEASTSPLYGVLAFATGLAGLFGLVKKKKEEDQ
ncbi:TPA: LPXTG cell wall anchor domain-containing protein, partial [Streptococcus suis]|nr:LPXTG cell wall anchor domain-containing protein [Streptococcus suis]